MRNITVMRRNSAASVNSAHRIEVPFYGFILEVRAEYDAARKRDDLDARSFYSYVTNISALDCIERLK